MLDMGIRWHPDDCWYPYIGGTVNGIKVPELMSTKGSKMIIGDGNFILPSKVGEEVEDNTCSTVYPQRYTFYF